MAAILRDSVVIVVVVRTRPRAIPLAMIAMKKSIHGFSFLSYMGMGLHYEILITTHGHRYSENQTLGSQKFKP